MEKWSLVSLLGGVVLLGLMGGVAVAQSTICGQPAGTKNFLLRGGYAFNFSGGDAGQYTGYRLVGSGQLVADGFGHISAGKLNLNYRGAEYNMLITSPSVYAVYSDGTGFMSLSVIGGMPGGQNGVDLTFTLAGNEVMFASDASSTDTCYPLAGGGDPFWGTAISQGSSIVTP
jgi:hypothetical protein